MHFGLERPDSKLSAAKPHLCRSLLLSQIAPGEEIVAALGRQLEAEFGRGFGEKNLRRMVQFAEVFPDKAKVYIDFEEAGKGQEAA